MHGTFTIIGIDFPAYFTLLMVGFMAGIYVAWRIAPEAGIDPNRILDLGILLVIGGIAGGRIAHVLFDGQLMNYYYLCMDPLNTAGEFLPGSRATYCESDAQCAQARVGELCHPFVGTCHWGQDCLRVFKFWYGGLTYYGGFLLVVPLGIWFLRRFKIAAWKVADIAAFAIPLGIGFGRLGCYYAGCCFGGLCDELWGVSFPAGSPAARHHTDLFLVRPGDESLPVHPAQLYSVVANWAIAGMMYWWYRRRRHFDGESFWLFVVLYSAARFLIEAVRDDARGEYFGVSTSQGIGLLLIALSIVMLSRMWRQSQAATSPVGPAGGAAIRGPDIPPEAAESAAEKADEAPGSTDTAERPDK